MTRLCTAVLAIFLAWQATRLPAQQPLRRQFRIGETQFIFTVPPGYCLPSGESSKMAAQVAGLDSVNVTHISAYKCEQLRAWEQHRTSVRDYALLKSPKGAATKKWGDNRQKLIAQLRDTLKAISGETTYAVQDDFRRRMEQAFVGLSVGDSKDLGVIDSDGDAVYIAGVESFRAEGKTSRILWIGAMTFVKQKAVSYALYTEYQGENTVVNLLDMLKTQLRAFIAEN